MSPPGAELDAARRLVVERRLEPAAFRHLTADAFMALPFEALAPTKSLLKRFLSTEPWTAGDDDALAAAVGAGEGSWQRALDDDLTLEFGWDGGRFHVQLITTAPPASPAGDSGPAGGEDPLLGTFDGPVVPEATPNPRTIRFHVGPIHDDPSRWYESAATAAEDPAAARLFAEFIEVANVLVGPDFVAVGVHRAADWERLLRAVLAVVTEEFATPDTIADPDEDAPRRVMGGPAGAGVVGGAGAPEAQGRKLSRLQQAWRDLGSVRPTETAGLERVKVAAASSDPAHRQVAASLLREADAETAAREWDRLSTDPVRSVRRAAVDAMVDVDRDELRPLLEAALHDGDAWVRWKALRGLAQLGADPSRGAVAALAEDPDFRVRLEVAAALRSEP